jgi:toxin CptA
MHNAPAVSYPVGRSRFQAALTLAVLLAGAAAQAVWWLMATEHGLGHVLGILFWCVTCVWAIWRVWHTAPAELLWDGQCWRWRSGASSLAVVPQVIVDGQHHLLLCLRTPTASALWAWPAYRVQPERWLALRRALFQPSSRPDEPAPSRPAAAPEV